MPPITVPKSQIPNSWWAFQICSDSKLWTQFKCQQPSTIAWSAIKFSIPYNNNNRDGALVDHSIAEWVTYTSNMGKKKSILFIVASLSTLDLFCIKENLLTWNLFFWISGWPSHAHHSHGRFGKWACQERVQTTSKQQCPTAITTPIHILCYSPCDWPCKELVKFF
jgi:hypothetical protein